MLTTTNQIIHTKSGTSLVVEANADDQAVEVNLRTKSDPQCLLHWGVRRQDQPTWEIPPTTVWPPGTNSFGRDAIQTPFDRQDDEAQLAIRLPAPVEYSSIDFALFYPDKKAWDNNNRQNYRIILPKPARPHADLEKAFREDLASQKVLFERLVEVESEGHLASGITKAENRYRVLLMSDLPGSLLLHWGIARYSSSDWFVPPEEVRPTGTTLAQNTAQTPFRARPDGLNELRLEFPESGAPLGLQFVLKQPHTGKWLKDRGGNFFVPVNIGYEKGAGVTSPALAGIADQIVKAEMGSNSWTLMHRYNLCHDLLDRVGNDGEGSALLFVWLRYSAIRQLTWQRNYNTKPRELSHAQDRLTHKLADLYRTQPNQRRLIRLMLGSVGRGGEGQRIRDEILNIMHKHHVKEVAGHFLEEWHQKLHNNTTPDDVVICEAYLEFLRHDGNLERFYQTLQAGGVTKARLESFERPIRSQPGFIPHLKDGLIYDFQNFLGVLKSVHSGTDLGTALQSARAQLDGDTQGLLNEVWNHRDDPNTPVVILIGQATEVRRRLAPRIGSGGDGRELIYLDLALEQLVRLVVECNLHHDLSGDQWVDLIADILENVNLSWADKELEMCRLHWARLKSMPRFGKDWSLHAKGALDRIARGLASLIDGMYQQLQPKAQFLGNAFHADAWTISLFSEEVVRGSGVGFALSMLVHRLDPLLRQAAQLGDWQIISRGKGYGRVEVVGALGSIQGMQFSQPVVVVADTVSGDEELPEAVTAVITPNVTDIVSHVAVRARNAELLFAACHDPNRFREIKSLKGQEVGVDVTAAGDVQISHGKTLAPSTPAHTRAARQLGVRPEFSRYAIVASEFNEKNVGHKALNLVRLQKSLPEGVRVPESVAVPFGVCEKVLSLAENLDVKEQYTALLQVIDSEPPKTLAELRECVQKLRPPQELVSALRTCIGQAHLEWPKDWEAAWKCITRVWASKWNDRAYLSRKASGIPHEDLVMSVLIQPLVEATYAFVIHTVNPVNGKSNELFAELVPGLGETLVGNYPGRALDFVADKQSGQVTLLAYPSKSTALYSRGLIFRSDSNGEDIAGYAGAGLYDSVPLQPPEARPIDYSQEPLIWDEAFRQRVLGRIAKIGIEVERTIGGPQDIEGAVAKEDCFVLQSRPQVGVANVADRSH